MPLHRLNEERNCSLQTLPANSICSFPKHDQSLAYRFLLDLTARMLSWMHLGCGQEPDCVLAVIAGYLGELIQDELPASSIGFLVSPTDNCC
jgi:hypothetical protein